MLEFGGGCNWLFNLCKNIKMTCKIIINAELCKGCNLCVSVCPGKQIVRAGKSNKKGYFAAQAVNSDCTGCAMCAIVCPEGCVEVYTESNIISIDSAGKRQRKLTEEKV